jgi:hypothetical protein
LEAELNQLFGRYDQASAKPFIPLNGKAACWLSSMDGLNFKSAWKKTEGRQDGFVGSHRVVLAKYLHWPKFVGKITQMIYLPVHTVNGIIELNKLCALGQPILSFRKVISPRFQLTWTQVLRASIN